MSKQTFEFRAREDGSVSLNIHNFPPKEFNKMRKGEVNTFRDFKTRTFMLGDLEVALFTNLPERK